MDSFSKACKALALTAVMASLVATVAKATIVQFSFDPLDLVTQASVGPYGLGVPRDQQDDPRRLHINGYGYPGDNLQPYPYSSAYFQTFYDNTGKRLDTNQPQPWYARGDFADPGNLTFNTGVDYFDQLWLPNAPDGGGKIRLNYFNLWIPAVGDSANISQMTDWAQNLVRYPDWVVTGSTGPASGWSFADLGPGVPVPYPAGPTFAKTASPIGVLDGSSLYRNSLNPFGTFSFVVRTPQVIGEGDQVTVWFGANGINENGVEYLNFHYGDPTPIQPGGRQPIQSVERVYGFEGTMNLTAHIIPEPATVGMILVGGLVLGATALRRRQGKLLVLFLSLCAFVASSAQAVTKQSPKLVRSDEPVHLIGLTGVLEITDAAGAVSEVRAVASAPRIAPPVMVHAKKGEAVLRAGEMYLELKEGGRLHVIKNTAAREIKVMVPKLSAAPATAYIEAKKISIEPSQVLEASYNFVRQEVTVGRSVAAPTELVEVAVVPAVTPIGTEIIAFSAEKGAPVASFDGNNHVPPVSPFRPPRAYPTK